MSRWPPRVTGAVRPGPEELARLQPPPPAPAYAAQATASTAAELARLRLRVPRPARPPRRGLLVAAAVALLAVVLLAQAPATTPTANTPQPMTTRITGGI